MNYILFDVLAMKDGDLWTVDVVVNEDAEIIVFDSPGEIKNYIKERNLGGAARVAPLLKFDDAVKYDEMGRALAEKDGVIKDLKQGLTELSAMLDTLRSAPQNAIKEAV